MKNVKIQTFKLQPLVFTWYVASRKLQRTRSLAIRWIISFTSSDSSISFMVNLILSLSLKRCSFLTASFSGIVSNWISFSAAFRTVCCVFRDLCRICVCAWRELELLEVEGSHDWLVDASDGFSGVVSFDSLPLVVDLAFFLCGSGISSSESCISMELNILFLMFSYFFFLSTTRPKGCHPVKFTGLAICTILG